MQEANKKEVTLKADRLGFELVETERGFGLRRKEDGWWIEFDETNEGYSFETRHASWCELSHAECWLDYRLEAARGEFVELLDRCRRQVVHDPTGFTNNPHLYGQLQRIMTRLCHGSIHDNDVSKRPHPRENDDA